MYLVLIMLVLVHILDIRYVGRHNTHTIDNTTSILMGLIYLVKYKINITTDR